MAHRPDHNAEADALLQRVIDHLRQQEIPDFPDPEIAADMERPSKTTSISPLRRIVMNRRFQLSAGAMVGMAALLGFCLLWGGIAARPVSAMEKMAEAIREAKSYKLTSHQETVLVRKRENLRDVTRGVSYWVAPRSQRIEFFCTGGPSHRTIIRPEGKPGISICYDWRSFEMMPAQEGQIGPLAATLDNLCDFRGQADRDLGTKEIDGKQALGFEIDYKRIDPDRFPGVMEVWLDNTTRLPISLRLEEKRPGVTTSQLYQFSWNIDVDPNLFDTTPPKGFRDATPKPPTLEEQTRQIAEALRAYADMAGGHYPRVKRVYNDVISSELYGMVGIEGLPTVEEIKSDKFAGIRKTTFGFALISMIQEMNSGFAYHGKTVGPKDTDKVLLRWKLNDGRYEVIFGDLNAKTVSAEELRRLETM